MRETAIFISLACCTCAITIQPACAFFLFNYCNQGQLQLANNVIVRQNEQIATLEQKLKAKELECAHALEESAKLGQQNKDLQDRLQQADQRLQELASLQAPSRRYHPEAAKSPAKPAKVRLH